MSMHRLCLTLCIVAATIATPASSAQVQKEGRLDFFHCMTGKWTDLHNTPELQVGYVHENFASTLSNVAASPFDGLGAHCAPVYIRRGGNVQVDGYCKYSDNDNDSWIMHFTDRVADGVPRGTFEFVAGSGKFVGATIQGEILPANGFPAPAQPGVLNRCTRVTGTYKLR